MVDQKAINDFLNEMNAISSQLHCLEVVFNNKVEQIRDLKARIHIAKKTLLESIEKEAME